MIQVNCWQPSSSLGGQGRPCLSEHFLCFVTLLASSYQLPSSTPTSCLLLVNLHVCARVHVLNGKLKNTKKQKEIAYTLVLYHDKHHFSSEKIDFRVWLYLGLLSSTRKTSSLIIASHFLLPKPYYPLICHLCFFKRVISNLKGSNLPISLRRQLQGGARKCFSITGNGTIHPDCTLWSFYMCLWPLFSCREVVRSI